jgi:Bacterial Ig domain
MEIGAARQKSPWWLRMRLPIVWPASTYGSTGVCSWGRGTCQIPPTYAFIVTGADLPDGRREIRFDVTGSRGNKAELSVVAVVDKAPVLVLEAPLNNAVVGNTLRIVGTSTDEGGPSEVEIRIDGRVIQRIAGGRFDVTIDTSTLLPGAHNLFLTANDVADNRSYANVAFVKQ